MQFIDEILIKIESGHGGPGSVSFRREAMEPRGGPDGGDGGKGGNIIFRPTSHKNTLVDYRSFATYKAEDGQPGAAANCSGRNGNDLILEVPLGTVVRKRDGDMIVDLSDESEVTILTGGRGGKGNHFFRTSRNQAPEHAQPGEDEQSLEIVLELKLIADVGIIGFPNAGKSTLISRISAARPKIADYPFTTLTPNLGVVKWKEEKSFVVADIPGLIRGAHEGVGLGIQFLKHIERTRILIHLIEVSGFSGHPPEQDFADLNYELEKYDEGHDQEDYLPLSKRPQLVVFNKIDTISPIDLDLKVRAFKNKTGIQPFQISGVTGRNIPELLEEMAKFVFAEQNAETIREREMENNEL